ncbi:MAG TPA: dihydropteroate synthase [Acidimicrobiales bacterium]|nr:dihydropteroate synthase [Acidimicrobiales bacterium]
MSLRLSSGRLELQPGRPVLMGVVNASPESFSDGSDHPGLEAQVAAALAQVEAGAALVDVGGESGVTDEGPISAEEEIRRVVPLVERLVGHGVVVSVDTWKPAVARAALDAGAAMINDVSGLADAGVATACAAMGAGLVVMHTRATPKRKDFPHYGDIVTDVVDFLAERIDVAMDNGVRLDQVVVDPGPDFAKTPAETVTVLRALPVLHRFGRPVLLAVSRKDFVGALTGRRPRRRLAGTLAAIDAGVEAGATILRVHDVAAVADYLRVRAALAGEVEVPADLHLAKALRRERPGAGEGTQA